MRNLLLFLFLMTACSGQSGINVGQIAPEFRLKSLSGNEAALSGFRGKVVLMNFWATWCGPCKAEMPSMQALYGNYKRADFEILAISIDTAEEDRVRDFVKQFGFTFPVLLDDQFIVNQMYEARVVPTSLLIDRQGVVRERILGARNWNDPTMRLIVDKLLVRTK